MIGRLSGTLVAQGADHAIVDVNGVGYEVHLPARDLQALRIGDSVVLTVETVVREDLIRLYGFRATADREWFRLLQSVQGVGAKVALGILSVLDAEALARAVALSDKAAVARAQGVGKRVAERIVAELKGKGPLGAVSAPGSAAPTSAPGNLTLAQDDGGSALADAVSALTHLGYGEAEARAAVAQAANASPDAGAQALVRAGLKALAA